MLKNIIWILVLSSFAGCSDTLVPFDPAPAPEERPAAPSGWDATAETDGGSVDPPIATEEEAPSPACDLTACDDVPPCFEATCGDDGGCEVVAAPAGTACANGDFCDVLSSCDGAGTCDAGVSAEMYATFDDNLRLIEARPDGSTLLAGGTLVDGSWRPVVTLVDPTGSLIWRRQFEASEASSFFHGEALDDGWIVSGYEGPRSVVVRLDASGETVWNREFRPPAGGYVGAGQVVVDGDHVFLFGAIGEGTGRDVWVRWIRAIDGEDVWTRTISTELADDATQLLLHGDEAIVLGRSEDPDEPGWRRNVWLVALARDDGSQLHRRELLAPAPRTVVWADSTGGHVELIDSEYLESGERRATLRRLDDDGLQTVAVLREGYFENVSALRAPDDTLVVLREAQTPRRILHAARWDRAGNVLDVGVLMSPTGDAISRGEATFIDRDTLVMTGTILEAQSSHAWNNSGSVLRRTRPFYAGVCTDFGSTGSGCFAAGEEGSCDDDNPCTADLCDAEEGCRHRTFYDGMPCAGGNVCQAGVCVSPCAATCQPGTGWCSGGAGMTRCEIDADGCTDYVFQPCDDGTTCQGGDVPSCEPS